MKEKQKKVDGSLILILFVILLLIVLIFGATYAYFKVNIIKDTSSVNVSATTDSVGVVSLSAGDDLKLELSAADMMKMTSDISYYATITGIPVTEENNLPIAKANVKGNGTMNCEYEISASISGKNNMYDIFNNMTGKSTDQLVLNVDGEVYDLYNTTFPVIISGTLNGLSESVSKNIMASFKVVNKSSINQSDLAGTDLTISFQFNKFDCDIVE